MLAATFMAAAATVATVPGLGPMKLAESDAKALGMAWATWIESFPSKRRTAAIKAVSDIMPGFVCFGTTAMVLLPRVQLCQALARDRAAGTPPLRTPTGAMPPPPFAAPPGAATGPHTGSTMPPDELRRRRETIDAIDEDV